MIWRCLGARATGTSHADSQTPCQDRQVVEIVKSADGATVVVAVIADGAGSAAHSERGAEVACGRFAELAKAQVLPSSDLDLISDEVVRSWFAQVRAELRTLCYSEQEARISDFAATSLVALISDHQALCAQVGDGGIVVRAVGDNELFDVAIWPENGEYANETTFVTDNRVTEHVGIRRYDRLDDVVLFSDGLQRLVLKQSTRSAYAPFFSSLLTTVRDPERTEESLQEELDSFLRSKRVNEKTDDDKSIVIACRLP